MASHNPTFIIKNTEPGYSSSENKEPDFINNWIDVSVENEVWRGKKLRIEKPIPSKQKDEFDVVNIDFVGPICHENRQHRRKTYRKHYKNHTSPCTPRSLSPRPGPPRPTSASSAYTRNIVINRISTPRKKTKHPKRCPMRIAELAVPTKRQCIDTWRNKSYLLPDLMVERLKQHVMDQRPIVQIPDAIYCFQRRGPHSSKNTLFKSTPIKNSIPHNIMKPLRHMDSKTLCIIFGNKIGKMLATPMNLTLNTNLEKLSKVVAWDISQILKFPKLNVEQDLGRSMQLEVANKVTVWIAGILEDLTFKLLEEDLKVKKEDEAKAQTTEQLVKIMEKILRRQQQVKSTDLEEEEGPVLDFLDSVVDKVMNLCEPPPMFIEEESSTSSTSKEGILEEESQKSATDTSTADKKTILEKIFGSETAFEDKTQSLTGDSENMKETTDEEYLRNEIYNIIKNIDKESNDEESESEKSGVDFSEQSVEDEKKEFSGEIDENNDGEFGNSVKNKELGDVINEGSGEEIENEEISLEAEENENGEYDDTTDMKNVNLESINQSDIVEEEDSADKNDSNVSEVFDTINEDWGDKNCKPVKLLVTSLVNPDEKDESIQTGILNDREKFQDTEVDVRFNTSYEKNRPNIMFAEPNEYLLSDADELWPNELKSDRPLLKLSESVSKSVTSLGNIFESDDDEDKFMSLSEVKSSSKPETRQQLHQQIMDNITSEQKIVFDAPEDVLNNSKYDVGSQAKNVPTTATKEIATDPNKASATKLDSELQDNKPVNKTLTQGTSPLSEEKGEDHIKPVKNKPKHDEHTTDNRDTTRLRIGSSSSLSTKTDEYQEKIPSHKTQSHVDYSWKVHPMTAPSWVMAWGHGRGEPSEDSIPIQIRPTRVKESEMRKWCKDLEKAYANLAFWSDWIDNTCKETISLLKRKENVCVGLSRRNTTDWIKLKKNINKDAILWTKLYQRTEENFKSLKRKYNHVEGPKNQKSGVHKAIFDAMYEFENLSVVLHRMIVSAEYCAMCTCNKTRKSMNLCKS